jgi:predicted ATPase
MARRYRPADPDSSLKAPFLKRIELLEGAFRAGEFPFTLPFLAGGSFRLDLTAPVTVLVGENGTGKSTLLEAIAQHVGFNLQGGSRDNRFGAAESPDGLGRLFRFSWLPRVVNGFFFRAESFFNFASALELAYGDPGDPDQPPPRRFHELSHGEAFLNLFAHRLGTWRRALYLFDEPEAALSPARQLDFLRLVEEGRRTGHVQYVIATHSPILMSYPAAELLLCEARVKPARLADTPHMRLYEKLMRDPRGFVAAALDKEDAPSPDDS